MLRDDFTEIFDFLTRQTKTYSLNTNGTLITPEIAQLLKRKGTKMIALYGATADVYDSVTHHPGGFDALMRGLAYLREAETAFTMQLVPMQANWHQWAKMVELAHSLSPSWRVGASWLYLSSSGTPTKNREIAGQRLWPMDVIQLDEPDPDDEKCGEDLKEQENGNAYVKTGTLATSMPCNSAHSDDRLFAQCIAGHREFHIDPYGKMTFCSFIKDPLMRYDLRNGTFREAWETFIPSLADKVRGGVEYAENCGDCDLRADCKWCAVYGYLEHGRYSAPVEYLCAIAHENHKFKEEWNGRTSSLLSNR